MRHIRSAHTGQDYLIKIRLPENYAKSTTPYPVLYLLDGDYAFAMATDIVQYLIYGGLVPDLIIISPAHGSKSSPQDGGTNMRNRDLVPFPLVRSTMAPGATHFLQFVQQELVPYVESTYRIDSTDRTIWGYSLGLFFVLYVLFHNPDLFKNYIAVDGFDEQLIAMEERYATNHTTLTAKLCLLSGSDNTEGMSRFQGALIGRSYGGLQLESAQLNDIGHFAGPAEGLSKGLVMAFRK